MAVHGRSALRRGLGRILGAASVLGLLFSGFMTCTVAMERRDDIPASWAVFLGSYDSEVFPDPAETTGETCTQDLPCRWAVSSEAAVVMMFDRQEDACRAEGSLPGTVRQDWVAVQFTPGVLSQQQRDDVLMHLDSYNRYPGNDDLAGLDRYFPGTVETCPS